MSTFSWVYKSYSRGEGGLWKSTFFPYTFNFFGLIFIIFMRIFGTQKMLMCTLFWGRGLRKCMVCTLMKMLTFMDGPVAIYLKAFYLFFWLSKSRYGTLHISLYCPNSRTPHKTQYVVWPLTMLCHFYCYVGSSGQ